VIDQILLDNVNDIRPAIEGKWKRMTIRTRLDLRGSCVVSDSITECMIGQQTAMEAEWATHQLPVAVCVSEGH